MADRNGTVARPVWVIQAEEAKLKSEAEKAAAAKAAFEATFRDVDKNREQGLSSDSEAEEAEKLARKPIGPVDPSKCSAAGAGVSGGAACAPSIFTITTKDSDGRKIPNGGALIKVKVSPGVGVGGSEIDGIVKDQGDGTYSATYVVPKRGNYMVGVECDGKPIMGSPFPVFFSAGSSTGGILGLPPATTYPNMVNPNMPNMPNYSGSVSGAFPGLLGMVPGLVPGGSGGVTLPGIGASLGEVCRDYLYGRCFKTDCKLNHPPQNMMMTAIAATTSSMGSHPQVHMAPSAAAMAAAQAIMAAQALQAHSAQLQAQSHSSKDSSGSSEKERKGDALKRTVQVSNLSPLLTIEQIKQLFGFCGTVLDCTITDSKHFAYIEYSKPEAASDALALNNMDVGGRPLNVEMAKTLPQKPVVPSSSLASSSLPIMMQQAVAMQQMQFQQALLMQQTMNAQQAANRAATVKSATDVASARAAEISKMLNLDGIGNDVKETDTKLRSPSPTPARSKSRSRSPVSQKRKHRSRSRSVSPRSRHSRDHGQRSVVRSRRRSRSITPPSRPSRRHRSRSRTRSRKYSRHEFDYDFERQSNRESRDVSDRNRKRDSRLPRDHHSSLSRRNKSRSVSPEDRRPHRKQSESPKHRHHESYIGRSRSPDHHRDRGHQLFPNVGAEKNETLIEQSRSHVDEKLDSIDKIYESDDKHCARRRSGSASAEGRDFTEGKLPPKDPDESKSKGRRSRSGSLDDRYLSKYEPQPNKLEHSGRRSRRRSRSTDGRDDIEFSLSNDEKKSKVDKRTRTTSMVVDLESDGERYLSKHGRRKHRRERRRSKSVSPDEENDQRSRKSRSKSDKSRHKHKKHSRSRSAEDRDSSKRDGKKAAKDDVPIGDDEKASRNLDGSDEDGTLLDNHQLQRSSYNGIEVKKKNPEKDNPAVFPRYLSRSSKLPVKCSNHGETTISGENEKGFDDED